MLKDGRKKTNSIYREEFDGDRMSIFVQDGNSFGVPYAVACGDAIAELERVISEAEGRRCRMS